MDEKPTLTEKARPLYTHSLFYFSFRLRGSTGVIYFIKW